MNELKRWHVTHQGSDKMPMVWKLEGRQVIFVGLSLGFAVFLFRVLVDGLKWNSSNAGLVAVFPPLVVLVIMLTLVKGKPKRHFQRWLEWQVLKTQAEGLLNDRPDHFKEFFDRKRAGFTGRSKSENPRS